MLRAWKEVLSLGVENNIYLKIIRTHRPVNGFFQDVSGFIDV